MTTRDRVREGGSRWTDERIEKIIGALLLIGVVASASVVLAGAIVFLIRHGGEGTSYGIFRGVRPDLHGIGSIVRAALSGSGRGMIQLGLLLLILTPIARVVFSLVGFLLQRDRIYSIVTALVMLILLYSLLAAR